MRKPAQLGSSLCAPLPAVFALIAVLLCCAGSAFALPNRLGDLDEDGKITILDVVRLLRHYNGTATLGPTEALFADLNQDGTVNEQDANILKEVILGRVPVPELPLARVRASSPAAGEANVAVTRETVFHLSLPLAANALIDTEVLYATFGGRKILSRVEVSSDRKTITLFYLEPLPSGARIRVVFNGNTLRDLLNRTVDLDGDGVPGGALQFDFDTVTTTAVPGTAVIGRVFASEMAISAAADGQLVNRPLTRVTITVDGKEETMRVVTDATGNFRLDPAPAGPFFVHIDGRTVEVPGGGYPNGDYYPSVGKEWVSTAGEEINIGNIYLPLIRAGTLKQVSLTDATVVTFPNKVIQQNPDFQGVTITVPAGSLFNEQGNRGGRVGIAPVAPDRLPSPLPPGLNFALVITVQTDGPGNFDQPVPVCFPNLPDRGTGQLLGPGEKSALWSFNHDIGDWEIVGSMTVSADGKYVCSDPGSGILQPGWHGTQQGCSVTGGNTVAGGSSDGDQECPTCQPGDSSDPVYLFSGEYYETATDLRIRGRGMDFVWARTYRSKTGRLTSLGYNWEHRFDMRVELQGEDLILYNGRARTDRYQKKGDGTWSAAGFFRTFSRSADQSFTYTLEDRSIWTFLPLDGSPRAGRLASMADRNGNTMRFEYDPAGRLARIIDTLDRAIEIGYTGEGLIETLTDFSGRTVRYTYYDGIELGGSRGDLKSVTSPAVVGTPNGNDFPAGKTTVYTYSSGFSDERLNHNLLTITFPRQNDPGDPLFGKGPYLVNIYSTSRTPGELMFDRIVRQIWGSGTMDYSYSPILPSAANGGAVMRAIMHDRVGNVTEYFFDAGNRMVRQRTYSGRADPSLPVTENSNRPMNKLRASDPEYFETITEYDSDSQARRMIHPNGNVTEFVYEGELNPTGPTRSRGNLRIVRHVPGSYRPVGDQEVLEERYEYDPFGFNFVAVKTDPRGYPTRLRYDSRGNLTRIEHAVSGVVEEIEYNDYGQISARVHPPNSEGQRRRDEYRYHETGAQRGYLAEVLVDAQNLKLSRKYEYDARGNVVRQIDSNGHDTQYVVNALDEIVRVTSRETTDGSGVRYRTDTFFDANENVIRMDVENRDENGALRENPVLTTSYEYDLLNNTIAEKREIEEGRFAVTRKEYDPNDNLSIIRHGEAVAGRQLDNVERMLFDERNMLFQTARGYGGTNVSTTQFDYDPNGATVRVSAGIENNPHVMELAYDAFGRSIRSTDPNGNVTELSYDPAGNVVAQRVFGELKDAPGSAGNLRLSETQYAFDPLNRQTEVRRLFFDPATQTALRSGRAVTRRDYSPNSQLLRVTNPNGHATRFSYDTANRLVKVIDAAGNSISWTLDANGNKRVEESLEIKPGEAEARSFVTRFNYDNLDRLTSVSDPLNNATQYRHDSRNNRVAVVDARGNVTRNDYDGLNRLLKNTLVLTETGTGQGAPIGNIITSFGWDDSSRVISQTDGNGHATVTHYDGLDRITAIEAPDKTTRKFEYDVHGNPIRITDANGTLSAASFDALNRVSRVDFQAGSGVATDTTFESFQYDGLSRIVRAENDTVTVARTYDSLYNITGESMAGAASLLSYDELGHLLSMRYPGGRNVSYSYDALERIEKISDEQGLLAQYEYFGPQRVYRRSLRNGTSTVFEHDGARRTIASRYFATVSNNQVEQDARVYGWNEVYRKTKVDAGTRGVRSYAYDSANRLVRSVQSGGLAETVAYSFDSAGNRTRVEGGAFDGVYSMNGTEPDPADALVNQYTTTPFDARSYNSEGNLSQVQSAGSTATSLSYDVRNRLTRVSSDAGEARYGYDAFGRRVSKSVRSGTQTKISYYQYAGSWQIAEEQNATRGAEATFVYGVYVDEPVSMQREGRDFFYQQDDTYNVTALTDSSGAVVEACSYSDYGVPEVSTAQGKGQISTVGNPYLFKGAFFDPETGWHQMRTRYYDPEAGRFITRDSIGTWGDAENHGNAYVFGGNDPINMFDPFGTDPDDGVVKGSVVDGGPAADVTNDVLNLLQLPKDAVEAAQDTAQCSLNHLKNLIFNHAMDANGSLVARSAEQTLEVTAQEMQALRNAEQQAANAGRYLGAASKLNTAAVGVGAVLSGVQEYRSSQAYSDSTGARAAGSTLVAGINVATSLNPVTSALGMIDSTMTHVHSLIKTEAYSAAPGVASYVVPDKPPKVMEIMNNAGRGVVAGVDALAHWDLRKMQPFVNDVKNNQGSISGGLAWIGENIYGEIGGSIMSLWYAPDEWRLERQRQALLAKRRGSPCSVSLGGVAPISTGGTQ